jgi:hypothetical protein
LAIDHNQSIKLVMIAHDDDDHLSDELLQSSEASDVLTSALHHIGGIIAGKSLS